MINRIKELAHTWYPEVVAIRRHLHAHPELAFEEMATADFIASKLDEYGISYHKGIAKTGIAGILKGKKKGKRTVALRADMDALPIVEENKVVYKSCSEGVMHACGHDVHMASLLGTARILQELRKEFGGTVKLIFQPSEEKYPGGALAMIKAGVLEDPKPDVMLGQHVYPSLGAGFVGMKAGKYMASTDEFYVTVNGKGGHAATPDMIVDPILIASHIIVALQQVVSRNAFPGMPTVVSVGRIVGDGRTNIIPDVVTFDGTVRTFDETWRKKIHQRIREICTTLSKGMGGSASVRIASGYPYLENNEIVTGATRAFAMEFLGDKKVVELETRMTAEDFSYFAQEVPSCFYRLGVRNEKKGITSNLHTSTFDIDEDSLLTGMGLMAYLTIRHLAIG